MRRFFAFLLTPILALGLWTCFCLHQPLPPLKDGDLIFHTSLNGQSGAILVATASPYTHMGIIKNDSGAVLVVEAVGPVKETPLADWLRRGLGFAVIYRYRGLSDEQADRILATAKSLYGRPYNAFFSFNNDGIYCSELAYLSYKAAGVPIGAIQKLSELHFNNFLVRGLIQKRWRQDPECMTAGYDFDQCYRHLQDRALVTPAGIAADPHFDKIYSSYPF